MSCLRRASMPIRHTPAAREWISRSHPRGTALVASTGGPPCLTAMRTYVRDVGRPCFIRGSTSPEHRQPEVCLLLRDEVGDRFDRAAVWWLVRFAFEGRDVTLDAI